MSEVTVYYTCYPLKKWLQPAEILKIAEKMPLKRYQTFLQLDSDLAKGQNVVAYLLLSKILREKNIDIHNLDYSYRASGKPYFKNSLLKFNISHSDVMVAVVVDSFEIGLDIEKIKPVDADMLDYVYSKQEQKNYHQMLLDEEFFCKTWTLKESYAKYKGQGLNIDFSSLTFNLNRNFLKKDNVFINSFKIADYFLSVCSERKQVEVQYLEFKDL